MASPTTEHPAAGQTTWTQLYSKGLESILSTRFVGRIHEISSSAEIMGIISDDGNGSGENEIGVMDGWAGVLISLHMPVRRSYDWQKVL